MLFRLIHEEREDEWIRERQEWVSEWVCERERFECRKKSSHLLNIYFYLDWSLKSYRCALVFRWCHPGISADGLVICTRWLPGCGTLGLLVSFVCVAHLPIGLADISALWLAEEAPCFNVASPSSRPPLVRSPRQSLTANCDWPTLFFIYRVANDTIAWSWSWSWSQTQDLHLYFMANLWCM